MDAGSIPASSIIMIILESQNFPVLIKLLFLCLVFGYLFGSIPIAYLYSKAHGVNILEFGSGNPGSTNVGRALGKKHGRNVFILDILKIILPVILISIFFFSMYFPKFLIINNINRNSILYISMIKFFYSFISIYTGLGGILGHNFPIFLKFNGGKGISCTMGAIFCFSIPYSLLLFIIYKIITKKTKYVSLGSLTALTVFFISSIIMSYFNLYPYNFNDGVNYGIVLLPGVFVMWLLGILRHKSNIIRLINGTENKISE